MSVLRCDECERFIDTDFEPGAYDEKTDRWVCETCATELALANEPADPSPHEE